MTGCLLHPHCPVPVTGVKAVTPEGLLAFNVSPQSPDLLPQTDPAGACSKCRSCRSSQTARCRPGHSAPRSPSSPTRTGLWWPWATLGAPSWALRAVCFPHCVLDSPEQFLRPPGDSSPVSRSRNPPWVLRAELSVSWPLRWPPHPGTAPRQEVILVHASRRRHPRSRAGKRGEEEGTLQNSASHPAAVLEGPAHHGQLSPLLATCGRGGGGGRHMALAASEGCVRPSPWTLTTPVVMRGKRKEFRFALNLKPPGLVQRALDGVTPCAVLNKPKSVQRCFSYSEKPTVPDSKLKRRAVMSFTHVNQLAKGLLKTGFCLLLEVLQNIRIHARSHHNSHTRETCRILCLRLFYQEEYRSFHCLLLKWSDSANVLDTLVASEESASSGQNK